MVLNYRYVNVHRFADSVKVTTYISQDCNRDDIYSYLN